MAFQYEMQYQDIQPTTEVDMTQIPEFPASSALQSIEGQNLKGAAFDVLEAYAAASHMADMRSDAFHALQRETGIPAHQLQPMVDLNPDLLGHRPIPAAEAHGLWLTIFGRGAGKTWTRSFGAPRRNSWRS